MKTVWKVFHGNREKGYTVAYMRIGDGGALLGIGDRTILLRRAEIADLLLTLEKLVYGHVLKQDIQRIEDEERRYRERKQKEQDSPLLGGTIDLTEG